MKLNKSKTMSAVAIAAALLAIGVGTVQAATCSVPSSYPTIQSAVNNPTCDTIIVAAGTYVENIGIPRGLSLRGPNFNISPNGGSRGAEAVITGSNPTIRISTTDPVTIDGFTFSGGSGAQIDSYTSGNTPTIKHNIFAAESDGFFFFEPALFTFEENYLHDLTDCGGCDGIFIAGNWDGSSGTVASIKGNVWFRIGSSGMNLSNVKGTISGNSFSFVTYYAALLANGTNVDISGNAFDHTINPDLAVRTWGAGIRFYTPSAGFGARITGNTFSNNYVGIGVRMGSPTADITGMDVYAHQNNFTFNTAAGLRHDGLGTFNATCDWWNSANGPANAGNPGGTGDTIDGSGPVTFAPWLNAPAPGGNCFPVATNADQCKKGGWATSVRSNGSTFKNQGDCIQYVNTGK
jgi:hypothetical protein